MKNSIFGLIAIVFVMLSTSCAAQRPSSGSCPVFNRVVEVVVVADQTVRAVERTAATVEMVKQRFPVQATTDNGGYYAVGGSNVANGNVKDITVYGGPGNNQARKVMWKNAALYSNGRIVTLAIMNDNGSVKEHTFSTTQSGSWSFDVLTGTGWQSINIISTSGRIDLYYANGTCKNIAGR